MNSRRSLAGSCACAAVAGLPAPLVCFVAASAFEQAPFPAELVAGALGGALYLAFAQFWVLPRGVSSASDAWPTVLAAQLPLLGCVGLVAILENPDVAGKTGAPWLAAALAGSALGAGFARVRGTGRPPGTPAGRRVRLLTAATLLLVAGLSLLAGVLPAVAGRHPAGFNTGANLVFFRVLAVLSLAGGAILGATARRAPGATSRPLRGGVATGALLSGLAHGGMGAVCLHYGLTGAALLLGMGMVATLAASLLLTIDARAEEPGVPTSPASGVLLTR